jgi:exodeoxyribonuclease VII small subunit
VDVETLTFEDAFAELQSSIEELRSDTLTLDRSMALYERGIALAERCNSLLTGAELRITLTAPEQDGAEQSEPEEDPVW